MDAKHNVAWKAHSSEPFFRHRIHTLQTVQGEAKWRMTCRVTAGGELLFIYLFIGWFIYLERLLSLTLIYSWHIRRKNKICQVYSLNSNGYIEQITYFLHRWVQVTRSNAFIGMSHTPEWTLAQHWGFPRLFLQVLSLPTEELDVTIICNFCFTAAKMGNESSKSSKPSKPSKLSHPPSRFPSYSSCCQIRIRIVFIGI